MGHYAGNCLQKSSKETEANELKQRRTFNSGDSQLKRINRDKIEEQNKLLMHVLIRKESYRQVRKVGRPRKQPKEDCIVKEKEDCVVKEVKEKIKLR
uniref:Uncharacterized protein n=1 Tax=Strongyloides papillosus TaxID=174720 RepID=A0A0N5BIV2_STREA